MPFIPIVMEPNKASSDVFSRLLKDGIVLVSGEVDSMMSDVVVSQLLYLQEAQSSKPIKMYINSPGGSVSDGMAIYDIMKMVSNRVETYCLGKACSMGAVLLAAGDKGYRYSLPHSRMMIHQLSSGTSGQATDIEIAAKNIQDLKEITTRLLSEDTGQPFEKVLEDLERDKWLSPKDAKEYGLIDHIFAFKKKDLK